ncbi:MAG TPA: folylpolyglutamate synthase/dihydrofolate synthase family protein [Acidimicrobiia bacterium]|nr:folylpolyglutamate synthase/dihydrofolate synthase family protein [Acidimicrobiia bacterium]
MTVSTAGSYDAAMSWLHSRQSLGIDLGLDRVRRLLSALGDPQNSFRIVHVTGTNGKGSVATLLARALELSAHRTGLYTSPHLIRFSERFQVDGKEISRGELALVLTRVRTAIDGLGKVGDTLTFFEICTAAAMVHFEEQGVAWAVVEAGMGGRLDATNVIHPELAVITNVSLDHVDFLGEDIETIAAEKAGIIEPGVPLVTAATGTALEVLRGRATGQVVVAEQGKGDTVSMVAAGAHQQENAAVVRAACDVLRTLGVSVPGDEVERALADTRLPGRLESFEYDSATVTIDSAHNPAGVRAVAGHIDDGRRYDMIVGFNRDKDWQTMLKHLLPHAQRVWVVPVRSPRSIHPGVPADFIRAGFDVAVDVVPSFAEALQRALDNHARDVLVIGSVTLAGEARAILTGQPLDEVDGSR